MLDRYAHFKEYLADVLHLGQDALHLHFGLVIFGMLCLLIRAPDRTVRALCWLTAIAVTNEVLDLLHAIGGGQRIPWLAGLGDIVNTIAWPAVLVLVGRRLGRPAPTPAAKMRSSPPLSARPGAAAARAPQPAEQTPP